MGWASWGFRGAGEMAYAYAAGAATLCPSAPTIIGRGEGCFISVCCSSAFARGKYSRQIAQGSHGALRDPLARATTFACRVRSKPGMRSGSATAGAEASRSLAFRSIATRRRMRLPGSFMKVSGRSCGRCASSGNSSATRRTRDARESRLMESCSIHSDRKRDPLSPLQRLQHARIGPPPNRRGRMWSRVGVSLRLPTST